MAKENKEWSQSAKPTGSRGRIAAKAMARGHKHFYRETANALQLQNDDRFLDIGFGSGEFIKRYASHVSRIAGIDHSGDMVELAKDINRELIESGKAEFRAGDAASLPWKDNTFTAVAGIETFYFWQKPKKALKDIHRVLVPGGRLAIEMGFNKDDGVDHSREVKKHGMRLYGATEMRSLLAESGFVNIQIEYFKCIWLPFKGHLVPKGMVVKGIKK